MQSMAYKVIIMPPAKRRLDMYVYYTLEILKKQTGGKVILQMQKKQESDCRLLRIRLKYVLIRFLQNMNTEKSVLRSINL